MPLPLPRRAKSAFPSFVRRRLSSSLSSELSLAEEVLHILSSTPPPSPLEPLLETLVPIEPHLAPHLVSTVLESLPPHSTLSAVRFFNWASHHPSLRSRTSDSLLRRLLLRDPPSLRSSLDLLKADNVKVHARTFEALIRAHDLLGSPTEALEAFDRMPEFRCRPTVHVYNFVISALVHKGLFQLATGVYHRMGKVGCRPIRSTFKILILSHLRGGRVDDVLRVFAEMLAAGFPPDTDVYNMAIAGLCRAGRLEDAVGLLEEMRRVGVPRCQATCATVLDGFCKVGKVDEAFRVLEGFLEEGVVLGLFGYTSMINGLMWRRRIEDAYALFRAMSRKNVLPDCVVYTSMIRGFVDGGRVKEAFGFLGEMIRSGIEPDSFCYTTLIKGLSDMGRLVDVFSMMSMISRDPGFVVSETYNIVICALCDKGMVVEALRIFEEMGRKGCLPTVSTYNTLISGLCKSGKFEEARTLFVKMEMPRNPLMFLRHAAITHPSSPSISLDGNASSHLAPKSRDLRGQVDQLCESGHVVQAYNVVRLFADSGIVQPDITTYTILISSLCKDGKLDEAFNLLMVLQSKGLVPDAVMYVALINGFRRHKRFDKVMLFIEDLLKSGCTLSHRVYYGTMKALCGMNNVACAVELWLSYISKLNELSVEEADLIARAKKHFEAGSVGKMIKCLLEIDIKYRTRYSTPHKIWLRGYCRTDKLTEAYHIFIVLYAYKIKLRHHICEILFHALCGGRRLDEAVDVFLYMVRGFSGINLQHIEILLRRLPCDVRMEAESAVLARMAKYGYNNYDCNLDADLIRKGKALMDENAIT